MNKLLGVLLLFGLPIAIFVAFMHSVDKSFKIYKRNANRYIKYEKDE